LGEAPRETAPHRAEISQNDYDNVYTLKHEEVEPQGALSLLETSRMY